MGYVITITRQFGSMGKEIAQETARILGWSFYERKQIEAEAAREDTTLAPMMQAGVKEYLRMEFPLGIGSELKQEKMFQVQSRLVEKHASEENCVIVGRCAEYILRSHPHLLRCYIYAPEQQRIANTTQKFGIAKGEFLPLIDTIDRAWEQYYLKYTGYSMKNTEMRDLLLCSTLLGLEGSARLIAAIAKEKFGLDQA
ncbi:MAG: cytidylate kinase-like family protein [Ruminococcus sp.]|nr:cytidylate kinase-like family protein [Ruminococcus sp.]